MAQPKMKRIKQILNSPVFFYSLAAALWAEVIFSFLRKDSYHTAIAIQISSVILLLLLVKLFGQLPLDGASYLVLAALLYIGHTKVAWVLSFMEPIYLACCLLLLLFMRTKDIDVREYLIELSFTEIAAALMLTGYEYAVNHSISLYFDLGRRYQLSPMQKAAIILLFSLLFLGVFTACARLLGRLFRGKHAFFQRAIQKFRGLELYLFFLISLTIASIGFFQLFWDFPSYAFRAVLVFLLVIETAYICLLLHAISFKEKMNIVQNERNSIAAYSADLEASLDHMREIRHDVKNLFLTMGGFVESSGDEQMKEFYQQNIVPFMRDAVAKSELQDKLKVLPDGLLKSFFYYKLIEKAGQGIHFSLEVQSPVSVGEGYGDIVRLLGILIDNAAEEAALTPEKEVSIRIFDAREQTGFRIANSVRPETRARGVIEGTTDKGLGRGNGLIIAKRIISRYDNMVLNSYFTEGEFVQNLTILRHKPPHA